MSECIFQLDQGDEIQICSSQVSKSSGCVCYNPLECKYRVRPCINKYIKNTKEECNQCKYPPFKECYKWDEQQSVSNFDSINHPEVTCEACRKTVPWKEGVWWQKATMCSITEDGYIDGTYDVLLCPECVEKYRKTMDNFMKGN